VGPLRKAAALAAIAVLLAPGLAGAAGVFDNLILSPRARAMGGAFVAVSDDETAIFTNPAGLAQQDGYGLYGSYVDLYGYDFLDLGSFSATVPTATKGTFGVGARLLSVEYKGVDLESEYSFSVGHGFTVMEDIHSSLSLGYALSLYGLSFDAESVGGQDLGSASTFGIDIGVMGTLRGRTTFGFFAKNINNPKLGDPDAEDLPQWFTAGVAYSPYGGVNTVLEMQKQDNEDLRTCFGIEFPVTDYITLRGGLQNEPDRLSVGFGTHWESIRVDYSYTSHGTLPGSHHFGLGYAF
jgi:voltage-gated potassium channel Kch